MRAIFISYRRGDSEGEAGRLFDDLVRQFGEDSVFMDVAAIQAGRDFRKVIDESVSTCGVLLAIIGPDWIDAKDGSDHRRLDDPSDFVRLETASALKRDIPVIPVLVRGATMPRADQLPDDLKDLPYRNGVELTHARWNSDVQLLFKALRPFVGESKEAPASPSTTVPQPAAEAKPPVRVETKVPPVTLETSPTPKKKPTGIILAAVAAVLVLGAVGGYMMLGSKKTQEELRNAAEQKELSDKAAAEKAAADQKSLADKAAADRAAAEKALAEEKTLAGNAAADKAAADKAIADKAAADRAIADKAAADRAAALAPRSPWVGTWGNADPATRGISKLAITQNGGTWLVHAWGSCHPQLCDWGSATGVLTASQLSVPWDQGFVTRRMTITLDGVRLMVNTDSRYRDNRAPQQSREYFVREP